jgi:urate oxidase
MSALLTHNAYGKSGVRLTKISRQADRHEIKEVEIAVQLEGEFAASYIQGDNSRIIATDSMKNAVHVLAKNHSLRDIESFGQALVNHFSETYPQVTSATVHLAERAWRRLTVGGHDHPHAFVNGGNEKRTTTVTRTQQGTRIESGVTDLLILKTTDSAFKGFVRDRYTTLPETDERILATKLTAVWTYGNEQVDWTYCHQLIRRTMLETFGGHESLAVQQTLHAMGAAALAACRQIEEINLSMSNQHRILVDLRPFGLTNDNEVFIATDEPYGLIAGTLRREPCN